MPPPVRSGIPKSVLQMPGEEDSPKAPQFLFGTFDESPTPVQPTQMQPVSAQPVPPQQQQPVAEQQPVSDSYQTRMFPSSNVTPKDNLSPPALKSLQSRFSPQNNLHSQSSQRKSTATQPNSEQNKDIQDHGSSHSLFLWCTCCIVT